MEEIVGVTQAAVELCITPGRVRELIHEKKLPAQKVGREWAILRKDLDTFKALDRSPGRPPNPKPGEG